MGRFHGKRPDEKMIMNTTRMKELGITVRTLPRGSSNPGNFARTQGKGLSGIICTDGAPEVTDQIIIDPFDSNRLTH